ncbi:MAG: Phosphoglycerate mutase [Solirubrobacterales bacterium]|jgi:broad specificity phosphatase PhoE|nr:Phosphoglycerate mutase [Solirubrobacterales bacterium]
MTDALPELWLARHGDTAWTVSKQHTGNTDLELNEAGVEAARSLGLKLAGREYDVIRSSPLRRALDTARLAGFDPQVDERLREFDYGDYEGITTDEIRRTRPDWDLWTDGVPDGETAAMVGARMDALISDLRAGSPRRVLVFGHGHALRILTARWLELDPVEGRRFLLGPAGVGVLGSEHGRSAVSHWNI